MVNWIVFFLCAKILGMYYLLAGFASFVIATLWNFIFARKFIFAPKYSFLKESALIYFVSFVGLCIDIFSLYIFVEMFACDEMVGKIFATGIAFLFNFSVRNFVIYK